MDLPGYLIKPLLALAWLILLGAPIAGYLLRKRWRPGLDAVLLVLMFTALVPALAVSGIATASHTLNLAFLFAAYAGYGLLAAYSLAIPPLVWRITAMILAYLPIACAYVMATIGALATAFLLAQSYPTSRHAMRPGLTCDTANWGIAGATAAGYEVNLYRYWAPLPWVRRLVYSVSVTVIPDAPGPFPGCIEVLQQYDHRH